MPDEDTEETVTTERTASGEPGIEDGPDPTGTAPSDGDEESSDGADGGRSEDAVLEDEEASNATGEHDGHSAATDVEDRVASFLDLERSLADRSGTGRARVVDAETVDAGAVPSEYPRSIESEDALALTLEHVETGDRTTAYFAWPPTDGSALDRLLGAVGVDPDSFADIHGRRLLVRVEDGHLLPVVPPTGPDGTRHGFAGVVAGHLANLAAVAGAALGALDPLTVFVALLLANLVLLPTATYLDAWHLKRTTDWDQAPSFWATLAAIPIVNLVSTALYSRDRRAARPIDGR